MTLVMTPVVVATHSKELIPMSKSAAPTCSHRTAVAYARYSSSGQRDVSIEQQLKDIHAYAEREGYHIVHDYADHARSGYKNISARAAFQAMMNSAKSGGFDTVLVWKADRFGRSREDAAIYKGQLRRSGVKVVYVMEPIPEGSAGILLEGMLEATAEWYSKTLSENVSRGMSDNARHCIWNGNRVMGYGHDAEGHYTIIEEEAAIVQKIFELYRSGWSYANIAKYLNSQGLRNIRGLPFSISVIQRTIQNESYIGTYHWGSFRADGGIPAIISKSDFEEANRMRSKTSRHYETGAVDYLLTGKAYCGLCGAAMVGDCGTSRTGDRHYYYSCQAHKARKGCTKKSLQKDYLEDVVIDFLLDHVLQEPEIQRIADAVTAAQEEQLASSPLASMESELADVSKQIANINNAIAAGVWSSTTVVKLKELETIADDLRASIDTLRYSQSQLLDHDRVIFFLNRFRNGNRQDPAYRSYLIRTFLNAVYVFDDHLKIVINNCEGNLRVPLSDLPSGSDSVSSGIQTTSHPNQLVTVYVCPLPEKKRA